jgi:hypothetical protein
MGYFGCGMTKTWSTTKAHPYNAKDDEKRWTKIRLECQQRPIKWHMVKAHYGGPLVAMNNPLEV